MADQESKDPAAQAAWDHSMAAHDALAARPGVTFTASEDVVIVLHPGFDTLDAIGPHYFSPRCSARPFISRRPESPASLSRAPVDLH